MEEENVQEVKTETKKFDFKKFDFKKYLPIIGGAVAAIILVVVLISVFGGGPKKAVKKYISGMNSKNAKKVVSSIDSIGSAAWGYQFDEDDFDEDDYEEFIESYEEYKEEAEDNKDEFEDEIDDMIDYMDDMLDDMDDDYKSFKIKIEEFKKVEKLGKDLYAVDAKISVKAKPEDKDDDEIDESEIMTFIVYKNKIISGMGV